MSTDRMGTTRRLLLRTWRVLGSLQLAAWLTALVLLATVLASLFPQMPQEASLHGLWMSSVALRYGSLTSLLSGLSLLDAFQSPWYLVLLGALLLNACICILQRLPRWIRLGTSPAAVTQVGTVLTHVGVPLLLAAIIAQPILSWQEMITGLVPDQEHALTGRPKLAVQTGQMEIYLHPGGQPRDYVVPLTILENQLPVATQEVRINHPLGFRRLGFHLHGFGPAARLQTPEGAHSVAFRDSEIREVFVPELALDLRLAYQPEGEAIAVAVIGEGETLLGSGLVEDGQKIEIDGTPLVFTLTHYTDWQVRQDPTFPLALIGAGMVLAGSILSLWLSRCRRWLYVEGEKEQVVGMGTCGVGWQALAEEMSGTRPESGPICEEIQAAVPDPPGDANG